MEQKNMDIVEVLEHESRSTIGQISEYFNAASDAQNEKITNALKLLSIYARTRATRANEMAISVMVARMMGLQGDALNPLWQRLTGQMQAQIEHSTERK